MSKRLRVYVAGPMTQGGLGPNVANGIALGRRMVEDGLAPYIPHLDAFMFWGTDRATYEMLLDWDFAWIAACEAVYRMDGPSEGADREVREAGRLGLPVFISYDSMIRFARDNDRLALSIHDDGGPPCPTYDDGYMGQTETPMRQDAAPTDWPGYLRRATDAQYAREAELRYRRTDKMRDDEHLDGALRTRYASDGVCYGDFVGECYRVGRVPCSNCEQQGHA